MIVRVTFCLSLSFGILIIEDVKKKFSKSFSIMRIYISTGPLVPARTFRSLVYTNPKHPLFEGKIIVLDIF